MILFNLLPPISYELGAAVTGWVAKTLYTKAVEDYKEKHVNIVFGKAHNIKQTNIYVGVFKPLTYDDLSPCDHTELLKQNIIDEKTITTTPVPMYSDVIVKDDYDAAANIITMLNQKRYRNVSLVSDVAFIDSNGDSLNISIGGPRSNHITKYILSHVKEIFEINDEASVRTLWSIRLNSKEFKPSSRGGFAYIIKKTLLEDGNKSIFIALAGDSASSTRYIAQYASKEKNIKMISLESKGSDFILLLKEDSSFGKNKWDIVEMVSI